MRSNDNGIHTVLAGKYSSISIPTFSSHSPTLTCHYSHHPTTQNALIHTTTSTTYTLTYANPHRPPPHTLPPYRTNTPHTPSTPSLCTPRRHTGLGRRALSPKNHITTGARHHIHYCYRTVTRELYHTALPHNPITNAHIPAPQTTATHSYHTPTVRQHPNTCVTTPTPATASQSFHFYPSTTGLLSVIGSILPQGPPPVSPLICAHVYPGHLSSIIKQFLLSWAKLRQKKLEFEANLSYRSIGV